MRSLENMECRKCGYKKLYFSNRNKSLNIIVFHLSNCTYFFPPKKINIEYVDKRD